MSMKDNGASLKRLQDVLAAYGGDPGRWPDDERDDLLALLSGNAEAGKVRAREQALDTALGKAKAGPPSARLRGRILQAAIPLAPVDLGARQESRPKVIAYPGPDTNRSKPASRPDHRSASNWPAAALLAASLLIGVWIGAGGTGSLWVSETLDIASLQSGSDSYNYDIGLSDAEELL